MKPTEIAKQWAKTHPDFAGLLGVQGQTGRGKGSWGSKTTTYRFVVRDGKAVRQNGYGTFNGICDVTSEVHLEKVLRWYHLPVLGWRGNFVTTPEQAAALGATEGTDNIMGENWSHPVYRRQCHYTAYCTEED